MPHKNNKKWQIKIVRNAESQWQKVVHELNRESTSKCMFVQIRIVEMYGIISQRFKENSKLPALSKGAGRIALGKYVP